MGATEFLLGTYLPLEIKAPSGTPPNPSLVSYNKADFGATLPVCALSVRCVCVGVLPSMVTASLPLLYSDGQTW